MKYVFFDIECADGGKGTICSFGYVITDESYNVTVSRDIIINPHGEFRLTGRKRGKDVILAYSEDVFRSSPTFDCFYDEIKSVLEGDGKIVIGHSTSNDAGFLNKSCKRYGKEMINFRYCDSQRLFLLFNGKRNISLDNAMHYMGLPNNDTGVHSSVRDAEDCMKLTQAICVKAGKTLTEIISQNPDQLKTNRMTAR